MTFRFLTAEELRHFTGRAQKSLQIDFLRDNGVAFTLDALGRPVVAWSAIHAAGSAPALESAPNYGVFKHGRTPQAA